MAITQETLRKQIKEAGSIANLQTELLTKLGELSKQQELQPAITTSQCSSSSQTSIDFGLGFDFDEWERTAYSLVLLADMDEPEEPPQMATQVPFFVERTLTPYFIEQITYPVYRWRLPRVHYCPFGCTCPKHEELTKRLRAVKDNRVFYAYPDGMRTEFVHWLDRNALNGDSVHCPIFYEDGSMKHIYVATTQRKVNRLYLHEPTEACGGTVKAIRATESAFAKNAAEAQIQGYDIQRLPRNTCAFFYAEACSCKVVPWLRLIPVDEKKRVCCEKSTTDVAFLPDPRMMKSLAQTRLRQASSKHDALRHHRRMRRLERLYELQRRITPMNQPKFLKNVSFRRKPLCLSYDIFRTKREWRSYIHNQLRQRNPVEDNVKESAVDDVVEFVKHYFATSDGVTDAFDAAHVAASIVGAITSGVLVKNTSGGDRVLAITSCIAHITNIAIVAIRRYLRKEQLPAAEEVVTQIVSGLVDKAIAVSEEKKLAKSNSSPQLYGIPLEQAVYWKQPKSEPVSRKASVTVDDDLKPKKKVEPLVDHFIKTMIFGPKPSAPPQENAPSAPPAEELTTQIGHDCRSSDYAYARSESYLNGRIDARMYLSDSYFRLSCSPSPCEEHVHSASCFVQVCECGVPYMSDETQRQYIFDVVKTIVLDDNCEAEVLDWIPNSDNKLLYAVLREDNQREFDATDNKFVHWTIAFVLALVAVPCVAIGVKEIPDLKFITTTIDFMHKIWFKGGAMMKEIVSGIGALFGTKTETQLADETMHDHITNCTKFLQYPSIMLVKDMHYIMDFVANVKAARQFLRDVGPKGSQHQKTSLVRICEQSEKKIGEVTTLLKSHISRPVPVCHLFCGAPGIGKTEACMYLAEQVRANYYPNDPSTYAFQDGRYWKPYVGQKVAQLQEFANAVDLRESVIMLSINSVLSNQHYNLEGAFEKDQPCGFRTVFMDTNAEFEDIAKRAPLIGAATTGMFDRMTLWKCEWTLDKNLLDVEGRVMRGHKKDFSHMKFIPYKVVRSEGQCTFERTSRAIPIGVAEDGELQLQLKKECTINDVYAYDSFLRNQHWQRYKPHMERLERICKDLDEKLGNTIFSEAVQKEAASNHLVINITGPSGSGKSTTMLSALVSTFETQFGIGKPVFVTRQNFSSEISKLRFKHNPHMYVFDDFVKYEEDGSISPEWASKYCEFYDLAPMGSLIVFISNVRKQATWKPTLSWTDYKWYNKTLFQDESKYRRMGYSGYFTTKNGSLFVPPGATMEISVIANQSYLQGPLNATQVNPTELANQAMDRWRSYIRNSCQVITQQLDYVPIPAKLDLDFTFASLEDCQYFMRNPAQILKYLAGFSRDRKNHFTVSPEIRKKFEYVPISEMKCTTTMSQPRDVVEVCKFYIGLLRRHGALFTGRVAITNEVVACFDGCLCQFYVYNLEDKQTDLAAIVDDDQVVFCWTNKGEQLTHSISIEQYVRWFLLKQDVDTEYYQIPAVIAPELHAGLPLLTELQRSHFDLACSKATNKLWQDAALNKARAMGIRVAEFIRNNKFLLMLCGACTLVVGCYLCKKEKEPKLDLSKISKREQHILQGLLDTYSASELESAIAFVKQNRASYDCVDNPTALRKKPYDVNNRKPQPRAVDRKRVDLMDALNTYRKLDNAWADDEDDFTRIYQNLPQGIDNVTCERQMLRYVPEMEQKKPKVLEIHQGRVSENLVLVTANAGSLFGIGVFGKYVICPKHILGGSLTENGLSLRIHDHRNMEEPSFAQGHEAVVAHVFEDRDLCLLYIPDKQFQPFRSLLKLMPEQVMENPIRHQLTMVVHRGQEIYSYPCLIMHNYTTMDDLFGQGIRERAVYRCIHASSLEGVSGNGDCGSPYYDSDAAFLGQPSLVGFHVGGTKDKKRGVTFCTYFDRKMIQSAIEEHLPTTYKKEALTRQVRLDLSKRLLSVGDETTVGLHPLEYRLIDQAIKNLQEYYVRPHITYPENGDVQVIGTVKGVCELPYPKCELTPYSELATKHGIDKIKGPALQMAEISEDDAANLECDESGRICPLATQTRLYCERRPYLPPAKEENLIDFIAPGFVRLFKGSLQRVNIGVALNGLCESYIEDAKFDKTLEDCFGPLQVDSSVGPTLNRLFGVVKKSHIVRVDQETGKRTFRKSKPAEYVEERVKTIVREACRGRRSFYAFKTCAKQENLKKQWKTRTFEALDMCGVLFERCIAGMWVAANVRCPLQWSCRLGINVHTDFARLAEHHREKEVHCCVDFKRWDKTVSQSLFRVAKGIFRKAHRFSEKEHPTNCSWCNAIGVLLDSLCYSFHFVATNVNYVRHGMKSGSFMTTALNSFFIDIILFAAYLKLLPNRAHSWDDYCNAVHRSTYGDDTLFSVNRDICEFYNVNTVKEFAEKYFGAIVDSMEKDGDTSVPYVEDIKDCSFISHTFKKLDHYPFYIGALKKESINNQIHYISRKLNNFEQQCMSINNAIQLAALWDEEYFQKYHDFVEDLIVEMPEFKNYILTMTRQQIQNCFYKGIVDQSSVSLVMKKLEQPVKESNQILRMASLNIQKSWDNPISAMNECVQSGWVLGTKDEKDVQTLTWTLTVMYEKNSETKTKIFKNSGSSLSEAKKKSYGEAFNFLKSNVFLESSIQGETTLEELQFYIHRVLNMQPVDDFPAWERKVTKQPVWYKNTRGFTRTRPDFELSGDYEKDWQTALDSHYALNDHHPEHFRGLKMCETSTIHMMCDLWASAMRTADMTLLDGLKKAVGWVFYDRGDQPDGLQYLLREKYTNANKTGLMYFLKFAERKRFSEAMISRYYQTSADLREADWSKHANDFFLLYGKPLDESFELEDLFGAYLQETTDHIVLTENMAFYCFGLDVQHDHDKLEMKMQWPYLYQWVMKKYLHGEERVKEMMRTEPNTVAGEAGPLPGTSGGPPSVPVQTGVTPGPDATLVVDNKIDQPGINYSGVVKLHPSQTTPDISGAPVHYNVLGALYSLPQLVKDYEVSDKSAPGDHVCKISLDPNWYPAEMKAWVARHQFAHLDLLTKVSILSSTGIAGALEVVYNPSGQPAKGKWEYMRSSYPYVTLSVDGVANTVLSLADVYNQARLRKMTVSIKDGVVSIGSAEPYPSLDIYVARRIENKYKDGFSIPIRVQQWFGPNAMFFGPRTNVTLSVLPPKEGNYSLDFTMPYTDKPISLYVQTTNRLAVSAPTQVECFPRLKGLFVGAELTTIVPQSIIAGRIGIIENGGQTGTTPWPMIAPSAWVIASGSFPVGFTADFGDRFMGALSMDEGMDQVMKNFSNQAVVATVNSVVFNNAIARILDNTNDEEIGRVFKSFRFLTGEKDYKREVKRMTNESLIKRAYCVYSAKTCGIIFVVSCVDPDKDPAVSPRVFLQEMGVGDNQAPDLFLEAMTKEQFLKLSSFRRSKLKLKQPLIHRDLEKRTLTWQSQILASPKQAWYDSYTWTNVSAFFTRQVPRKDTIPMAIFPNEYSISDVVPTFLIRDIIGKGFVRDPRLAALRMSNVSYNTTTRFDLEFLPYDDFSAQLHSALLRYCDLRGAQNCRFDIRVNGQNLAYAHFNTLTGLGINASDFWRVYTQIQPNTLTFENFSTDVTDVPQTNTMSWPSYVQSLDDQLFGDGPIVREAAIVGAIAGSAISGIGNGITAAAQISAWQAENEKNRKQQLELLRQQGMNQLANINMANTLAGENQQKLAELIHQQKLEQAGVKSPALQSSGGAATSLLSTPRSSTASSSSSLSARYSQISTDSVTDQEDTQSIGTSLGSIDSNPIDPIGDQYDTASIDSFTSSTTSGSEKPGAVQATNRYTKYPQLHHIPGISADPGTKVKDAKFPPNPKL